METNKYYLRTVISGITLLFLSLCSLKFSAETKDNIKEDQLFRCDICGQTFKPSQLKIHHKIPRRDKVRSSNSRENGAALCKRCHEKADRYADSGIEYDDAKRLIQETF